MTSEKVAKKQISLSDMVIKDKSVANYKVYISKGGQ